ADLLLAGRRVDAIGVYETLVVDDHVAVLPGDLRKLVLGQLARTAADRRHLVLPDFEAANDQIAWHGRESSVGRRIAAGPGASRGTRPCPHASSRRASGAPRACTAPCGTDSTGSRCVRSRCGSGCGSDRRARP